MFRNHETLSNISYLEHQKTKRRKQYQIRQTKRHICKKMQIIKDVWQLNDFGKSNLNLWQQPHRLNKQKVHCSCPLCTQKVSNSGWKHSDKQHLAQGWDDAPIDETTIWEVHNSQDKVVYSTETKEDNEFDFDLDTIYKEEEKDKLDAELVADI